MGWWWSASTELPQDAKHSDNASDLPPIPAPNPVEHQESPSSEDDEALRLRYGFTTSQSSSTAQSPFQPLLRAQPTSKPSIAPFPDTMSCRQAFDDAFYCSSLGGQVNNVYRYGKLKNCSDHWSQFWFCMRNKSKGEDTKKELVRDWYEKKEKKYREGPSSEDVWDERKVKVKRAFDWDPVEAGYLERRETEEI